jgi:hypothetical protein
VWAIAEIVGLLDGVEKEAAYCGILNITARHGVAWLGEDK